MEIDMGRAGSGGSGGHHSSGGGHSAGRAGGGHRVSSGGSSPSRAGSGMGGSSHRMYRGGMGTPPPPMHGGPGMPPPPMHGGPGMPPPRRRHYRYGWGRRYTSYDTYDGGYGSASVDMFSRICSFLFIIAFIIIFFSINYYGMGLSENNNSVKSTVVRQRLDTDNAYINDCIIDEIGWFNNTSKTALGLKKFWEETGIQPYIILKAYDESLITDAQKNEWTTDYYDANFDTENIFLYVYFAEQDTDNDVGYMAYANGYEASSVMDSEAVDIFWNYIDRYWYTDEETDDVFVYAFNDTANTIMHVSTTGNDIVKYLVILAIVTVIAVTIIRAVKQRNERERQKAQEDAKILNTPIKDMTSEELENKYLNN